MLRFRTHYSITPLLHSSNTPRFAMSEVHFIDTTLRDGQQSLWALGMRTEAMLAAAESMDRAGFESLEFFCSSMIKKYVREQKQDPWEWVREGTKRFRRTRLRLHGGHPRLGRLREVAARRDETSCRARGRPWYFADTNVH